MKPNGSWALGDGEPVWVCVTMCLLQDVPVLQAEGLGQKRNTQELSVFAP